MSSTITLNDPCSQRALAQRDLTDPQAGPHALQQLITDAHSALAEKWHCRRQLQRGSHAIPRSKAPDLVRPLPSGLGLRPNMRALLPDLLAAHALDAPEDLLLIAPGQVYRRSPIAPLYSSEPHQLELWRLRQGQLSTIDLAEMLRTVMATLLPGHHYRLLPATRPHLALGMRIDVLSAQGWLMIGRTGLLAPAMLVSAGLDPERYSVMGMSLGLDRILMQRKGIPHIQLLRSELPDIVDQMLNLDPFQLPAGDAPMLTRELPLTSARPCDAAELADQLRLVLPERLDQIAAAEVHGTTLRLRLHHPLRRLTEHEADAIAAAVAAALQLPETLEQTAYA
ncbi:MAG: hypothetical protein GX093_03150 [Xanthomonadaceae bacterium]|nr:hypothetical protein [Xanthomonadaceae bacterium]